MAAATAAAVAPQQPVSAQVVGNAFVQQYYHILHNSPGLVHRFYQDISKLGRPEENGSMSITTTMQAINEKIVSLNYGDIRAEIKSVDAQDSFNGGVQVLVTGYLTGRDNTVRNFSQAFFLAPQDNGYFVLNDIFRYVDSATLNPALVADVIVSNATEPIPAPVLENHVSEQSPPLAVEEVVDPESDGLPENGDVLSAEEEVPVPVVIDEVQDDELVVESSAKIEEVPKKSYASIVMHLKENSASFSPPPASARKVRPKSIEQAKPSVPPPEEPVSGLESVYNEHNQEGEADGCSIYIKGLPMTATESLLEEVFMKFGTIKNDGIQVRSNRQQGFCFGFVEFEDASSVQKALKASPIPIGGRQAFIEEKRSTNSRGNNRGRFQPGRGTGFRNEGIRGRGNYGGGRGYNRNDYNGRGDFGNRAGNRGGSSNRDGYQRPDNFSSNGGRVNRGGGGMANGTAKNTPRVSATA